jgi:fucose 4-O-acetylase-like acetyltransferase
MQKIKEYDSLRIWATFLVIIGHCRYYTITTNYGGINYSVLYDSIQEPMMHKILGLIVGFIYSFHMPLFIALSGALFRYTTKEKEVKFSFFVKSKINRLVIPFIVVSIFYSIPIKFFSGYYNESNNLFYDIFLGQICLLGNSHLWFLITLFFDFIIIYIIEKIILKKNKIKLGVFFCLWIIFTNVNIPVLSSVLSYLLWFYLGYIFEDKRNAFNKFVLNYKKELVLSIIIMIALFIFNSIIDNRNIIILGFIHKIIAFILIILGCYISYTMSLIFSKKNIYNKDFIKNLSIVSFGLYLYSDPLNYLFLYIISNVDNTLFSTELGSLIIFFIRLIGTFILAYIITDILKKLKIKYIC